MMKSMIERNKECTGRVYMTQVARGISHDQRMRYILTGQYMTDQEAHQKFMDEFYKNYKKN